MDCPDRVVAAPILMPLGFFVSATRPATSGIGLVYVTGLALGVGAVTLCLGLLLSG